MTRFAFMVTTVILSLAGTLQAKKANSQSLKDYTVSLQFKNVNLETVLNAIEKQTDFTFAYNREVGTSIMVSISASKITLYDVLKQLEGKNKIHFEQVSRMIKITKSSTQQPGRISGKVLDERGEPLPGATLKVLESGQIMQSNVDGSYVIHTKPGNYTLEISYISFQTRRITEIAVTSGKNTVLDVVMKTDSKGLKEIVVTAGYKSASIEGLYARQKNEAGISNGLSREQISNLPDKNVGETLKRISGVSTNDNRRVVVRGIAERYNLAMMDGAVLPSTDVQVRDFEFDIVPSNMIDNVIVSKTSTPDMSFGFGGGLVQINTLAIPDNNFNNFSFGSKYTNGSTGKDFLGYGRGKYDYLGFDDGSRSHFPDDLLTFSSLNYNPANPYTPPSPNVPHITPEMIGEQNRRIGGFERMGTRIYKAAPGQNYQFSLGRNYQLKNSRLGFVSSLSYRNEQVIDKISDFERGDWEKDGEGSRYDAITGKPLLPSVSQQYNFNTSWGALLNAGWNSKNHSITSRNFYSRMFSNQFSQITGWGNDFGRENSPAIREYDRPKFVDLLQNRINGEHRFGAFRLDWNVSRNKLKNLEKDATEAWLAPIQTLNGMVYNVMANPLSNPGTGTFNRAQYDYEESNKIAEAALSYQFNLLGQKQSIKSGYQYMKRKGFYDWFILPIGSQRGTAFPYVPVQQWGQFLDFKNPLTDLMYYPASFSRNGYEGQNTNQAYYAMLDNRFNSWLRLVWGLRTEYYKYERLKNGSNDLLISTLINQGSANQYVDPETGKIVQPFADAETEEKTWRYLPSASFTATPLKDLNIRAAYAQSVVRPALIENSRMLRYDPAVGSYRRNEGVLSTLIDHYDLRVEWYPKPGEVISAGYFYKYFDQPVELYRNQPDATGRVYLYTQNSDWAKVHGWEFDLRKSLGFIYGGWKFLDNIYVSGNLTLQSSEVQASVYEGKSIANDLYNNTFSYRTKVQQKQKRALYGQIPVVYNLGMQYDGNRFGANIAYNHMGYKTFTTGLSPEIVEYERPRNQLDAQLSYKFLRDRKLGVRLNMSNLVNDPYRFYTNTPSTYKLRDQWKGMSLSQIPAREWNDIYEWKYGFSDKYEEGYYETSADGKTKTRIGDKNTFSRRVGSSFSLSISYAF